MAAISGKNGSVETTSGSGGGDGAQAEITGWTFNTTSNNPSWASSTNPGYKKRVAGVKDATGTINGKYNAANAIFDTLAPGVTATLTLKLDSGNYYTVPAIIDDFNLEVDMDNGDVVGWTANFSSNGAWANPGDSL